MLPRRGISGRHLALGAVLGGGAAVRVWFMRSYRPAFAGYPDARAYVIAARGPLYWNQYKPVGYPLALRGLRALDGRLSFTIAAQHAMGVGTAALAHAMTARHLERRSLALLPAALVAFGGSQVFLEHSILSDAPYTLLLTGALVCCERSHGAHTARSSAGHRAWPAGRRAWLAGAGSLLAASVTLRTVGIFLVPALGAWACARPAPLRARVGDGVALAVPFGLLMLAYLVPQARHTGRWSLTRSGSFTFYARMAPLADAARTPPPAGTEALWESGPPAERPNLNWYVFDHESPALRAYGDPPYPLEPAPRSAYRWAGEEPTRRFARAVLRHQPLDYAKSVLEGLANYVAPRSGRRSVFEYDQPMLIRMLHDEHYEALAAPEIASFYTTPAGYRRRRVERLDRFGRAARTEGPVTAALAVLALSGCVLARGRTRSAAVLCAASALTLAVSPVAILFYDVRYAAPMVVPLSAAAAIGIDRWLARLQKLRRS